MKETKIFQNSNIVLVYKDRAIEADIDIPPRKESMLGFLGQGELGT